MIPDEYTKTYAERILEAFDPVAEAQTIVDELNTLVDDEEIELTEKQRDKIIYEVKYMVDDEMTQAESTRELDEEAIIEALDILEKGEV
jgi:hypothetical protein